MTISLRTLWQQLISQLPLGKPLPFPSSSAPPPDSQDIAEVRALLPGSLRASVESNILTITLNRPEVLNAIDLKMAEALRLLLKSADDDDTIRSVLICGAGRAFCSGGDLKFALQANPEQPGRSFRVLTTILNDCIQSIRTMAKPVVAVIHGPAAGAGLFIALACDLRIMAESAYLKQSNTSYGLSLPAGGTFFLPRLVGMGLALELSLLDHPIDAPTAQSIGLVNKVVDDESLSSVVKNLAYQLAKKPNYTVGRVKQLLNESFNHSLAEQLIAEQNAIVECANHPEGREGLAAFVQKRKSNFTAIG